MALFMAGAPINKSMVEVERELAIEYGFVPELFRAQRAYPLVTSAEARLFGAVLLSEGRLTRPQKKGLLFVVASARGNEYWQGAQVQDFPSDDKQSRALTDFALQLACCGLWFSARDVERLTRAEFDDQAILEAVVITALGQMLSILTETLKPSGETRRDRAAGLEIERPSPPNDWQEHGGPYLKSQPQALPDFEPFSFLRDQLGFIPKLFHAQMSQPDLLAAEIHFLEQIVHSEEPLSRIQKEEILLAVSASNLNTYGVALQRQILDGLGVAIERSDEVVNDLRSATVPPADRALLQEVQQAQW